MNRRTALGLLSLTTVLVLVLGLTAVYTLRQQRLGGSYSVTAYFPKAIGLFKLSDVRILGVAIGDVREVVPEGDRVRVVMELDSEQKIPSNARAVIIPISLISDRYIQFFPPYSGKGPTLKDGDVLGLDRTSIPVELDDLLANLKKFLDAVEKGTAENPGAIGSAVSNAAAAFAGTGENLDSTLGSLGSVSVTLVNESAKLESLIISLNRLFVALADRQREIASLNRGLAGSLGALAEEQDSLDGTLRNLALLTKQLGSIAKDHRPQLEADLSILSKTTQAALRQSDSLIRTNNWLRVVADGAEYGHNGGAAHPFEGITHVDVRDSHSGACPFGALACAALGLSTAEAGAESSAEPQDNPPGADTPTPGPDLPEAPDLPPLPGPQPEPTLPPLPSPPPLPAGAVGGGPLPPPGPGSWFQTFEIWVLNVSEFLFGWAWQ